MSSLINDWNRNDREKEILKNIYQLNDFQFIFSTQVKCIVVIVQFILLVKTLLLKLKKISSRIRGELFFIVLKSIDIKLKLQLNNTLVVRIHTSEHARTHTHTTMHI